MGDDLDLDFTSKKKKKKKKTALDLDSLAETLPVILIVMFFI